MSKPLDVSALQVQRDADGVLWITFDRPEASNAVTPADMHHIIELFTDPANVPRAVVFAATGARSFSAGMHLRAIKTLNPETARQFIRMNADLLALIRQAPFATICAINGHCLAAGLGIALVSDIRIVADHATFGLPEIKVGVPSVADIALLQQFIGLGKAKEMILTGDNYPVREVPQLANVLVPLDRLMDETRAMVKRVAGHTRTVMAAQKRLFEAWQNTPHRSGVDTSVEVFANVFAAAETSEQAERHHASLSRKSA